LQALHKRRIEASIDVWSKILKGELKSRDDVVEYLKNIYDEEGIEPIRGKTKINIYDKELATVFIVGRYGLGLDNDEIQKYFEIFTIEKRAEDVIAIILEGENPRTAITEKFGTVDENIVFRILRLAMTSVLLGFMKEDDFINLLFKFEEEFSEFFKKIQGFKRFYIAFRLAEEIASGKVRNRIEKEALKHALCLRLKAEKVAPPDWLIREIATKVIGAPEFRVNDALRTKSVEARIS